MRLKLLVPPILIWAMPWSQAVAAPPAKNLAPQLESEQSTLANYPFWISVGGEFGANPLQMHGGQLAGGLQLRWIGFDLELKLGTMTYGSIAVAPSSTDTDTSSAAGDPTAERARPRSSTDPWSYLLIEPGVTESGRLFANRLPQFSERLRFGLGAGNFNDEVNQISFAAFIVSFEGDIDYQLKPGERWVVRAGLAYNSGVLITSQAQSPTYGRLPASWLEGHVALVFEL